MRQKERRRERRERAEEVGGGDHINSTSCTIINTSDL